MFQILKLHLQGLSAYRIARKLGLDPPMVYASLKAAKTNFAQAENMLTQLKTVGWPTRLLDVEKQIHARAHQKRTAQAPNLAASNPPQSEEIALKFG
jgi:transcriptional regulator